MKETNKNMKYIPSIATYEIQLKDKGEESVDTLCDLLDNYRKNVYSAKPVEPTLVASSDERDIETYEKNRKTMMSAVSNWIKEHYAELMLKDTSSNALDKIKYEDKENMNEPILYIILNKDANTTQGEKFAYVSHLTSIFMNDFQQENAPYHLYDYYNEWNDSFGGYGNTIVLEATEEEIYDNCMSHYDNVYFNGFIEDTKRVAHHNWKLDLPEHKGFVFFGLKDEMPKWVRKLPLAK